MGGESKKRSAFQVAGDRKFRDFRQDNILDTRQFQVAFRRLRQFSSRADEAKTEFDVDGTIRETCDNAGNLKVVYNRPRRNTVKVLLLMDSGGSMDYYSRMCSALFQAVSKSNHFKDLQVFYFHNCIYSKIFKDPRMRPASVYRHVLVQKRYPHHGAVAFDHVGKYLFEIFKFLGIKDIAYNQPKSLPYPTENPFA